MSPTDAHGVRFVVYAATISALVLPSIVTGTDRKKMVDVPEGVKQRVVAQFLAAERAEPQEIKRRLRQVFGETVVDVGEVVGGGGGAGPEARQTWTLDPRLRDRVLIQFLTAERIGAKEIFSRLREAYGDCLPASSVQRWAQQFRNGRTNVGNLPRHQPRPRAHA